MSLPPEDLRRKIEEALLRKADLYIRCLRRAAEEAQIDTVEVILPQLAALLKVKEFPTVHSERFRETSRAIALEAYRRSVEILLYQAEHNAREGDEKARNEALASAREHFAKAIRSGADEEFRATIERRVRATLLTTAAGVDERTKQHAARKLAERGHDVAAPGGKERRRAIRFAAPALTVDMDGHVFTTSNWSQHGLLIEGWSGRPPLKPGDRVRLLLGCAGIDTTDRQAGRVVRVDAAGRKVAVEFPEISTIVLDLIKSMKRLGMPPRPQ